MNGLPVRSAVLGSVRLLATVAAVLLPVLVMAVLLLALGERGTSDESLVGRYDPRLWIGLAAAAAVHVALVIAVCGAGADTEPRAVARGLLGLSAGLLAVVLAVVLAGRTAAVVPFSSVVAPWCYLLPRSFSDLPPWSPLATMLGLAVLAAAFVYRYGAALDAARSTGGRPAGAWSRVWALVSKAMAARPLRPGAYLLWAISMVTGLLVLANNDHGREEVVMGAVLIAVLIAAVAALLVPIAVFVPDLDPRINTFWRSRPISPTCWFWATYGTALVAMIATIALLAAPWLVMAAAEAAVARGFSHHALWGWSWHFLPLGLHDVRADLLGERRRHLPRPPPLAGRPPRHRPGARRHDGCLVAGQADFLSGREPVDGLLLRRGHGAVRDRVGGVARRHDRRLVGRGPRCGDPQVSPGGRGRAAARQPRRTAALTWCESPRPAAIRTTRPR
jgi:hypothetical protein